MNSVLLDKSNLFRYFCTVNPEMASDARDLVRAWAAAGKYLFTTEEFVRARGGSIVAARAALRRLKTAREIASPFRGFHVYVPPEHQALGCLPPEQFIPQLMERLSVACYAALLTAARYHGAAHQQPQRFQVVVPKNRLPLRCGRVEVEFIARHNAAAVPAAAINTPRGYLRISTPEATAFDLVGYPERCGGIDNVATVLVELAEKLQPDRLAEIGPLSPTPWAQRLGYLLERLGESSRLEPLAAFVVREAHETVALVPGADAVNAPRDGRWKLRINAEVEPDL